MLNFAIGVLLGISSATALGVVLCEIFGKLTVLISLFSLGAGAILTVCIFKRLPKKNLVWKFAGMWSYAMVGFFIGTTFLHFYWLIQERNGVAYVIDDSNFVDLPNHLTYIHYFSNGARFWPQDVLDTTSMTYPFGMDFFNSLLSKLNLPVLASLPLVGFVSALLLLIALWAWGGGFALGGFLFSGGGYNCKFLWSRILVDYQSGKPWCNLLPLFSSQRGYLFAMPAGVFLLWRWYRKFFGDGEGKKESLPPFVEGILWGIMPLFHVHTFIVMSFVFACWALSSGRFP